MYETKLASYYDVLFSGKNYGEECKLIKTQSKNHNSLLDVGCGTLNHSLILSDVFSSVVAIDLSKDMINVARQKNKKQNILLMNSAIEDCEFKSKFDCVISMFNVVNHIHELQQLQMFFHSISKNLNPDGVFIFDCWNGVACTIEQPKAKSNKQIKGTNYTLISKTETETNLFESLTKMKTTVEVFDDQSMIDSFIYNLNQSLWTPNLLIQILNSMGFGRIKIIPYFDVSKEATEKDYRLTFICRK